MRKDVQKDFFKSSCYITINNSEDLKAMSFFDFFFHFLWAKYSERFKFSYKQLDLLPLSADYSSIPLSNIHL